MINVNLPCRPFPKERPRARAAGGKAFIYTPSKTKAAEASQADAFLGAAPAGFQPLEGPLDVILTFDDTTVQVDIAACDPATSKLRGDLDNYAKTTLDALNGVAWVDDRQITKLTIIKL